MRANNVSKRASRLVLELCVLSSLFFLTACGGKKALTETGTRSQEPVVVAPAQETEPAPQEVPMVVTDENEDALLLDNVNFGYDKFDLNLLARGILEGHARLLRARLQVEVVIGGHCDERGTIEYNLALGEKRALAVKNYLIALGVEGARLSTVSYGKERPLDYGQNEAAWSKNRRAEFNVKNRYALSEDN